MKAFANRITFPASLLLYCIVFHVTQKCDAQQNTDYCENPIIDANHDTKWLNDNYSPSPSPFLFGNKVFRTNFVQLLRGKDINPEEEDYSGLCAVTVLPANATVVRGNYQGFGNLTFNRNCSNYGGNLTCEFTNSINPDYKISAKAFVSYFGPKDKNNYHIMVYCFGNGNVGWGLISLRRELPEVDIADAKQHLKSRGFDTQDFITLYKREKCQNV